MVLAAEPHAVVGVGVAAVGAEVSAGRQAEEAVAWQRITVMLPKNRLVSVLFAI